MYASKYIRPMSFGELVRSVLGIFIKTVWPIWLIYILITFAYDPVFSWAFGYALQSVPGSDPVSIGWVTAVWDLHLLPFIILPAFFIGPSMLTISNIVLVKRKKTFTNFLKGTSFGMIFKILLFFLPILILLPVLRYAHVEGLQPFQKFGTLFLLFTIPLLLLMPVWVFYPMIILLEKKNILESIKRIPAFVSGQFKRLLQIQILLILLTVLVIPLGIYYNDYYSSLVYIDYPSFPVFISSIHSFGDLKWGYTMLADYIANSLFYVMPLIFGFAISMYVLYYYQVRAEKENFTEELLAQELGYQLVEEMMTV